MFYMAVYDSITELFKQALLVHHVMVLEPLASLTTAEVIRDLVREGRPFCTFPLWNCEGGVATGLDIRKMPSSLPWRMSVIHLARNGWRGRLLGS
ncbi:hypothetical protein I314_06707 [Cryptococcus bacillisporus CA1873]|uniref:Uncharacterized protein n=1 Tax=Cryptococcus bacillisporus CA1873 TaxID=1296111 RepID=A0ABR5B1K3_CRYGA|nr:hypothetical protein I314_06707 [Cryptococcus bacillisporus CA1873]|eukprot:KIR57471.1 hypothetical protein I314_06707 [Cryptococcus gattii CA1873]